MRKPYLVSALCLLLLVQCRNSISPGEVVALEHYPSTVFVPTMEEAFKPDRNVIYTPTFLLAWDGLKKEIKLPLTVSKSSHQLELVNRSNSFRDALAENEYQKKASVSVDAISISTFFRKSLDLEVTLDSVLYGFRFRGKAVRAFGMPVYKLVFADEIRVLYYKNDDEFIVKLIPRDRQQELILVKGAMRHNRLDALWRDAQSAIAKGGKEMQDGGKAWKYAMLPEDKLIIPLVRFNIETNYKDIEGQYIRTSATSYQIEKAYQRTAFTLDEHGAILESEAEIAAAVDSTGPAEPPRPKKLFFDKPFLIVMKKVTAAHPYFMMKVDNAELMEQL